MPYVPPRWFVRTAWKVHKALLRLTRDRVGLALPERGRKYGMMRLHTVGRRTGQPRAVVLAYVPDGERLVTLAMNGWGRDDPAWLLNLRARPEVTVDLIGGSRRMVAAEATGTERDRLWAGMQDYKAYGDLDAHAAQRGSETAVVVLTPAAT